MSNEQKKMYTNPMILVYMAPNIDVLTSSDGPFIGLDDYYGVDNFAPKGME